MFKEDEIIKIEELYLLWMAEGLISVQHKAKGMMLLDVAESLMDELAHRNLVQVEKNEDKEKSWSKYKTCSVHDLFRDLCLSKAKDEKFIKIAHLQPQTEDDFTARRLCINPYNESMLRPYDTNMISHVRSLFVVSHRLYGSADAAIPWPYKILSLEKFKLLRNFTVQHFQFTKQEMKIISKLLHLKCLSLRDCVVEELPSSISNLRNLEILDLQWSTVLMMANVLWKLKHLKFLYLPQRYKVDEKLSFKGLDELEVIHGFHSNNCDTFELIGLCKIKVFSGTFKKYLGTESDVDTGKTVIDFIKSKELRHSNITIDSGDELCLISWLECCLINVLRIFAPLCRTPEEYDHTRLSSCLSKLTLEDCRMEKDPMILLEKLPSLRILYLEEDAYLGTEMVCTAQGFPKLQTLILDTLKGLKQWRVEEGAMPNLSSLQIESCDKLEMLPEGLRYLAVLETLAIGRMPDAFTARINGINGAEGEDMYKISHVPGLLLSI